jgi:hypothetical protein
LLNNKTIVDYGLELTDACWNTYKSTLYVNFVCDCFLIVGEHNSSGLALAPKPSHTHHAMVPTPVIVIQPRNRPRSTHSTVSISQAAIIFSVPRS